MKKQTKSASKQGLSVFDKDSIQYSWCIVGGQAGCGHCISRCLSEGRTDFGVVQAKSSLPNINTVVQIGGVYLFL